MWKSNIGNHLLDLSINGLTSHAFQTSVEIQMFLNCQTATSHNHKAITQLASNNAIISACLCMYPFTHSFKQWITQNLWTDLDEMSRLRLHLAYDKMMGHNQASKYSPLPSGELGSHCWGYDIY